MRYLIIFLLLASLMLFTASNSVYGLSCDGSDITQSFVESDAVFAGQVLSKEYVASERSSANGRTDALTQFSIIENFKGASQETISIISSEWMWGFNFTENLEYVVFAYYDDRHLRHQTCTPTSLLEDAELEQIRQVANDLELIVTNSTHVKWNIGKIQWSETNYPSSGTAVVRVIDPDMNLNPEKIDNSDVFVWSDSHTKGLALTVTETGVSTGVFEGTLFLTLSYEAMGHRLKVAEGDTITAEYEDMTLPASYTEDSLSIFTKSEIRPTLESPLKQSKSGVPIHEIQCDDSMVLMSKDEKHPACVTQLTAKKLSDRGWFWVLDIVPWNDAANKPDDHKINCDNQTDPYQEFQCFKDAHSNCRTAIVNPEIYTIEGDPIYTTLAITSDCKIQGVADMSTDRFWGEPEIIITTCNTIERDEYSWSADNCDARQLPEMQFNFMMQIYPQILECEENGNAWNREKLECVKENED